MSTNGVNLDPDRATLAGRLLGTAGDQILRVLETTGTRIEQAGQSKPWGGDDLGKAFAGNYSEPASLLVEVWRAAAERTAQLGGEIVTAVASTVATDEAAAALIARSDSV